MDNGVGPHGGAGLLAPAAEQVLQTADDVDAIGRDLAAARAELMHRHAAVRWMSPAAQAHQAQLNTDLRRLEELEATCSALSAILRRLGRGHG